MASDGAHDEGNDEGSISPDAFSPLNDQCKYKTVVVIFIIDKLRRDIE